MVRYLDSMVTAGPFRGIILDVDGTLLDSNDAHARAWSDVFGAWGFDVPFERVRPLIGMGGDQILPRLLHLSPDQEPGSRISQERKELFKQHYLPRLRPTSGARALVEELRRRRLALIIGTSASADELEALLVQANVAGLVTDSTVADDVDSSKPAPDVVEEALARLGLPPDKVLMIGDTRYDIESAAQAGVRTVALRCGGAPDVELEGAWAILDDPADLLARLDEVLAGSPPEAIVAVP